MVDPWFIIGWGIIGFSSFYALLVLFKAILKIIDLKDAIWRYIFLKGLWYFQKNLRKNPPLKDSTWMSPNSANLWYITGIDPIRVSISNRDAYGTINSPEGWQNLIHRYRLVQVEEKS